MKNEQVRRNIEMLRADELMRQGKMDEALKHLDKATEMERPTYSVRVMCRNCGYEGTQDLPKGIAVITADCTNCGCTNLLRCDASELTNSKAVIHKYLDDMRSMRAQPETMRKLIETIKDGKKMVEQAAVKAKGAIKERKYEQG